jgi:hypothetical protein
MSKKVVKSISADPVFYAEIEKLAKRNRLATSVIIEEALKEVILGQKSSILDNVLGRK